MPRKRGYDNSEPVQWVMLSQIAFAEAITSATGMKQELKVWFADAVNHHLYRCEQLQAQERYRMDEIAAAEANRPTPDKLDPRYAITRPTPAVTRAKNAIDL